jgi:hypothetical protein
MTCGERFAPGAFGFGIGHPIGMASHPFAKNEKEWGTHCMRDFGLRWSGPVSRHLPLDGSLDSSAARLASEERISSPKTPEERTRTWGTRSAPPQTQQGGPHITPNSSVLGLFPCQVPAADLQTKCGNCESILGENCPEIDFVC